MFIASMFVVLTNTSVFREENTKNKYEEDRNKIYQVNKQESWRDCSTKVDYQCEKKVVPLLWCKLAISQGVSFATKILFKKIFAKTVNLKKKSPS